MGLGGVEPTIHRLKVWYLKPLGHKPGNFKNKKPLNTFGSRAFQKSIWTIKTLEISSMNLRFRFMLMFVLFLSIHFLFLYFLVALAGIEPAIFSL